MLEKYIGAIGLLLLVISWIPQTLQNIKENGKNLSAKFVFLYLLGSLALAYHAYILNDFVFLALNSLASIIAIINFIIIFNSKNKERQERKRKQKE
jgi:lipid-A-disaccharide synthase-like uncharacterized protein